MQKTASSIKKVFKNKKDDTETELKKDVKMMLKIQTILINMIGIGMTKICNDIRCNNLNWRTFDELLGKSTFIFKVIRKIKTRKIKHLIMQYITPYTTFLPFNMTEYLLDQLYDTQNTKSRNKFKEMYKFYEDCIFNIYINNTSPSIYIYPMFPPPGVFNYIVYEYDNAREKSRDKSITGLSGNINITDWQ